MYFRTAYELLKSGKSIKHYGTSFEFLWHSKTKNVVMMRFKNGTNKEIPYEMLNKFLEENSNKWELVN